MFFTFLESWEKPEKKNIILCDPWKCCVKLKIQNLGESSSCYRARDPAALVAKNVVPWVPL